MDNDSLSSSVQSDRPIKISFSGVGDLKIWDMFFYATNWSIRICHDSYSDYRFMKKFNKAWSQNKKWCHYVLDVLHIVRTKLQWTMPDNGGTATPKQTQSFKNHMSVITTVKASVSPGMPTYAITVLCKRWRDGQKQHPHHTTFDFAIINSKHSTEGY